MKIDWKRQLLVQGCFIRLGIEGTAALHPPSTFMRLVMTKKTILSSDKQNAMKTLATDINSIHVQLIRAGLPSTSSVFVLIEILLVLAVVSVAHAQKRKRTSFFLLLKTIYGQILLYNGFPPAW